MKTIDSQTAQKIAAKRAGRLATTPESCRKLFVLLGRENRRLGRLLKPSA